MTLQASFPLSMTQIATELGRSLPLSLLDSWVVALAGKSGAPVSFSDLLGKTAQYNGSPLASSGGGGTTVNLGSAPWFGGHLNFLVENTGSLPGTTLAFSVAPNWAGNIKIVNNATSVSLVVPKTNSTTWSTSSAPANLLRAGFSDSISILPSN
jgi:hypothetical protein